jgi:hypothetical protein
MARQTASILERHPEVAQQLLERTGSIPPVLRIDASG